MAPENNFNKINLKEKPIIKIVGIGGAGCNMVSNMVNELGDLLPKENFVAMNTDAQSLSATKVDVKVQLGDNGLGAGSDPKIGRESAEYSVDDIKLSIEKADLVIIVCGFGGGTGSGAAKVVSAAAQELGALVISILTKPFAFEGKNRSRVALEAIDEFKPHADVSVVVSNQLLFMVTTEYTTFKEAFKIVDKMCSSFVRSIVEILDNNGLINVDFSDIRSIIKNKGSGAIGIGFGEGETAAIDAAKNALSNQLLEKVSIKEASNALVHIFGNDITLHDIELVMDTIGKEMNENVHIIHGISLYNGSDGDTFIRENLNFSSVNSNLILNQDGGIASQSTKWIRVMIIATGLSSTDNIAPISSHIKNNEQVNTIQDDISYNNQSKRIEENKKVKNEEIEEEKQKSRNNIFNVISSLGSFNKKL